MNHFRTVVSPGYSPTKMGLSDKILTIGSCFADSIGSRLHAVKLPVSANPFGTLYNPHSIHKAIRYAVLNEMPPAHSFLQQADIHLNYDFHSEVSTLDGDKLRTHLKDIIGTTHYFLTQAKWLIITFGTAWVYERNDTGEIVANCHKLPGQNFSKLLLREAAIVSSFEDIYQELLTVNPGLRIILTVSPVRHLKDTLELNSVSKSVLRTACFSLSEKHQAVEYFPAYEMMMDDLRDYRFYKEDMIHPTAVAEDYIWKNFATRFFSTELDAFTEEWTRIQHALAHRPFHPASSGHQAFLKEMLKKLESFRGIVDVDREIRALQSQLAGGK